MDKQFMKDIILSCKKQIEPEINQPCSHSETNLEVDLITLVSINDKMDLLLKELEQ